MTDADIRRVGSTFQWTVTYGTARHHDAWKHVAFGLVLLVMAMGSAVLVATGREAHATVQLVASSLL